MVVIESSESLRPRSSTRARPTTIRAAASPVLCRNQLIYKVVAKTSSAPDPPQQYTGSFTLLIRNLLMRIGRNELSPLRGCDAEFLTRHRKALRRSFLVRLERNMAQLTHPSAPFRWPPFCLAGAVESQRPKQHLTISVRRGVISGITARMAQACRCPPRNF